jgi:beta-glucanase (GH16 family)
MQLPAETGMWPAFWLLGTDFSTVGWPDCGEIDVMEEKGRLPDIVYSSLHHGPTQDVVQTQSYQLGSGTFHDGWHVLLLEWDAGQLQWSVDGTPFFTILKGNAPAATWPFDQPFFVIFDLAVGGRFDANLTPPVSMPPQRLYLDYVRVYQKT